MGNLLMYNILYFFAGFITFLHHPARLIKSQYFTNFIYL
nr:MAG TPA: hypothetical protein [Bacteriophage sp.]